MYDQSIRKTRTVGNLKESTMILNQLQQSPEHLKASSFMSVTVFDAMSVKNLDENYL